MDSADFYKEKLNHHFNKFNSLLITTNKKYKFSLFKFSGNKKDDQIFLNKAHSQFEKWKGNKNLI